MSNAIDVSIFEPDSAIVNVVFSQFLCWSKMHSDDSGSSDESDSTEEEERLRRLFSSCDRDGDGYIDRLQILTFYS